LSDGPSPEDFRAKVFEDRETPGNWRVEKMDEDGGYEAVKVFTGPDARQQAIRYAEREFGAFDEIRLEPYRRRLPIAKLKFALSALTSSVYRRLDAARNPEEVMVRAVFANDHQTYRWTRRWYRHGNGAAVEEIDHRRIAQQ
jgi:hypothetical protein